MRPMWEERYDIAVVGAVSAGVAAVHIGDINQRVRDVPFAISMNADEPDADAPPITAGFRT